MKHLKTFEDKNSSEFIQNLKIGDKVVYVDGAENALKIGQTYIITGLFIDENLEVDNIKDCRYITVKDLNGKDTLSRVNDKPMLIYPKRFISLLKYDMQKYNI